VAGEQFHFHAESYLAEVRREVPAYDELQAAIADAAASVSPQRVLDLGAGTGETSRVLLERCPGAAFVLLDESPEMLANAVNVLPDDRIERVVTGDLLDALPDGPFDAVISALAVHHLDSEHKRLLFSRVRGLLPAGGRFVIGDVVVPDNPADAITPLSPMYDRPDRVEDLLSWLGAAGFATSVPWTRQDLAVIAAVAGA